MMLRIFPALIFLFLLQTASLAQSNRADLNLVIAMDCSWSVNGSEYALQAGGVAAAFSDPEVVQAITDGYHGRISVLVVHW